MNFPFEAQPFRGELLVSRRANFLHVFFSFWGVFRALIFKKTTTSGEDFAETCHDDFLIVCNKYGAWF